MREKKTKILLSFYFKSNGDLDNCNDTTCELCNYGDGIWMVNRFDQADYVLKNNTPWYNSCYSNPMREYKNSELEIVEFEIEVKAI